MFYCKMKVMLYDLLHLYLNNYICLDPMNYSSLHFNTIDEWIAGIQPFELQAEIPGKSNIDRY